MGILDTFIPMDRREALARGVQLLDRTNGSALFADISGFTHFSQELFNELGSQLGAEILTQQLNKVYGALIDVIHRYHGSVISFAGDAITCWFDGDNGRLAAAAALEMQKVMIQLEHLSTPSGSIYPLGIKVAVTSGNARRFVVGIPSIQNIEVLAGEILDRMAAVEKQLKSGEVVVGSEVMGRLGNQAIVKEWRQDESGEHFAVLTGLTEPIQENPWTQTPDLDPELARGWLLPPVYQRLMRGEGDFLAELRPGVAIFVKFQGIDYDGDDLAGEKLNTYISWLQELLSRYEGMLHELIIGDKGSYVFSTIGARVAHEDDVDRALSASIEMTGPPPEVDFIRGIQIGITRGQMRVGTYGAANRRIYGAHGNTVNIAARFMEHAQPGQILTSVRIRKEAASRYKFTSLGTITFKGFEEPFQAFQLTGSIEEKPVDLLSSDYPIVGRDQEKEIIDSSLQTLITGNSTHIAISGDAGIGKSRLVEYAYQQAQQSGVRTMLGLGDEVRGSSLFFAWRPIFRDLFDLDQAASAGGIQDPEQRGAAVIRKLEQLAPDQLHIAPLLNEILSLDIPDNELTRQMTGEVRAENIRAMLVSLLKKAADACALMLIMEDAHWFDSASWAMLRTVARDVWPIMLVIAYRPLSDPVPAELADLLALQHTYRITLGQLNDAEIETMLLQRLHVKQIPRTVFEAIQKKAEGNPFFSEELAYALRDQDLVQVVDGNLRVSPESGEFAGLDFPDTSQDVIRSRIDRLAPQEQLVLKVASVIGRTYQYRILQDVHPVETDKPYLSDYLYSLEHRALTRQVPQEPEITYRFQHNIIHEVAYNLMLFTQRRDLHRVVAEWYESHYAGDLPQVYTLLAYHWNQTTDSPKAIEYLESAAYQAMQSFANRETINYLSEAFSRLGESDISILRSRKARWELLLGEAYVNLADYVRGREHVETGLSLLGKPVPNQKLKKYAGVLRQVIRQVFHRLAPNHYLGRLADQSDDLLAASRACERLVEVYFGMNEVALSLYTAFRTLNLAEDAGISPELARGYATVGALVGFIPLHGTATSYLERALETVDAVDDLNARVWVNIVVAYYYIGVGNWKEAARLLEQALETAERLGDQRRREDILGNLSALNYLQGRFSESAQVAAQLIELATRRSADYSLGIGLQEQAYAFLHQGRFDQALQALQELESLFSQEGKITDEALLLEMHGLFALANLKVSELEGSLEAAELVMQLGAGATPSNYSSFAGYSAPACVYLTLWEQGHQLPGVEKLAWKACRMLRKFVRVFPIAEPRALLYEGWYFWLVGRQKKAHQAWNKSLEAAARIEMTYDRALALLEIGRHLPEVDQGRKECLDAAIDIFTAIGADYDKSRALEARNG